MCTRAHVCACVFVRVNLNKTWVLDGFGYRDSGFCKVLSTESRGMNPIQDARKRWDRCYLGIKIGEAMS